MKLTASVIALLACLLSPGRAQVNSTPGFQPTPLEAFAKQTASRITWSAEAGRIDSSDAHAVITALAVEDAAQPPDRLRGIRIDLSGQGAKDQVYLGEETLGAFKDAADQISRSAAHGCAWNSGGTCGPTTFVGAALFWYADKTPSVHTLSAAHYFMQGSSGLVLDTLGVGRFWFPDQNAAQLAAALARAIDQLKQR